MHQKKNTSCVFKQCLNFVRRDEDLISLTHAAFHTERRHVLDANKGQSRWDHSWSPYPH